MSYVICTGTFSRLFAVRGIDSEGMSVSELPKKSGHSLSPKHFELVIYKLVIGSDYPLFISAARLIYYLLITAVTGFTINEHEDINISITSPPLPLGH